MLAVPVLLQICTRVRENGRNTFMCSCERLKNLSNLYMCLGTGSPLLEANQKRNPIKRCVPCLWSGLSIKSITNFRNPPERVRCLTFLVSPSTIEKQTEVFYVGYTHWLRSTRTAHLGGPKRFHTPYMSSATVLLSKT